MRKRYTREKLGFCGDLKIRTINQLGDLWGNIKRRRRRRRRRKSSREFGRLRFNININIIMISFFFFQTHRVTCWRYWSLSLPVLHPVFFHWFRAYFFFSFDIVAHFMFFDFYYLYEILFFEKKKKKKKLRHTKTAY